MMGTSGSSLLVSSLPFPLPPPTPNLGLCPGHAGVCQCLSKCRALHLSLLRLPQVSQQKPSFAWLWNKPLGEPMRQQLDQLQRPSTHISVPGQAFWHPTKLFWASPTAWSPSCVGPMAALCGGASKGLAAWETVLLTSLTSAPAGRLCDQEPAISLSSPGLGQYPQVSGQGGWSESKRTGSGTASIPLPLPSCGTPDDTPFPDTWMSPSMKFQRISVPGNKSAFVYGAGHIGACNICLLCSMAIGT